MWSYARRLLSWIFYFLIMSNKTKVIWIKSHDSGFDNDREGWRNEMRMTKKCIQCRWMAKLEVVSPDKCIQRPNWWHIRETFHQECPQLVYACQCERIDAKPKECVWTVQNGDLWCLPIPWWDIGLSLCLYLCELSYWLK